jgi:AraC-like DNA-binding protein
MIVCTRPPPPALSSYVAYLWFHEGLVCSHRRERVLPDGTCELVINLDPVPRKLFRGCSPDKHTAFHRAWVSGAHSRFFEIDVLPVASMAGVHFRPGVLSRFFKLPASELQNAVIELDRVIGTAAIDLRDAVLEQNTPAGKFRVIESFLFRASSGRLERSPIIANALRRFESGASGMPIGAVPPDFGISHKHFIRLFHAEVGLTPKKYCRIQRFQKAISRIQAGGVPDWAGLALECGYFDQAHFIRDFQDFSGLNPSVYAAHRVEHANFVPVAG